MGGSRTRKKAVGEKDSILLVSASGRSFINNPIVAPRNTNK